MGMTGMIDGTQMYHDAIKRIQQLEKLNATLAAEIDRMRPVVDMVTGWFRGYMSDDELMATMRVYEESQPQ